MTVMTGKEALMQILLQEEVPYVFGIPGATEVVFMDALEDHPEIKFFLGPHETVAIGMAEGYARASGKVGFVNFHTNTGLAASLPLLYNSLQGGVPLIVTAGQQDTRLAAQEPALGADLVGIAKPFTKWATEITNVEDIPLVMRKAFKMALHSPQGPVFVSLPQNILTQSLDFEYSRGELPFTRHLPDPQGIITAARILSEAKNPIMIVEDGVTRNDALAEVVQLAELCGARVYQQWMSDVNFPVSHPLYMGDIDTNSISTREMLGKADVLVVIGAPFFSQAIYTAKPLVPSHVKIIQIDDNPWQIGKNFPVQVGFEGNIQVMTGELCAALRASIKESAKAGIQARIQAITKEKKQMEKGWQEQALKEKNKVPMAASQIFEEIKAALQPGTRIVDDCWSYSAILRRILAPVEAKSYYRARGGGSIGWGLPGVLGVKLASGDRPVVCISGDGSAMWSIQSLWAASHYNIPVTYIIFANSIYRQVRVMKTRIMGDSVKGRYLGTDIAGPRIDFCGIAQSMGMPGIKVERAEDLAGALKNALSLNKPNLVEITVDGNL